jgi:prepilin-type N-terminal cleavage/methylation domain-containing protein
MTAATQQPPTIDDLRFTEITAVNRESEIGNRHAFTLIEVLVAIALVLALVGTMYGFLHDMLSARRRVIEHVWQETAASALIKQLDADLHTCIVGDSVFGSGVQGDSKHMRILMRGVAAHLAGRGADDPDVFGDLQLTEYRFDEANRRIEGRRAPASDPAASPPPFAPLEGAVYRVRFRYHDGEQWQRRFDSRASNRLPTAVEVAVWYRGESGENETASPGDLSDASTQEAQPPQDVSAENETAQNAVAEDEDQSLPPPDRVRIIPIADAEPAQPLEDEGGTL